MATKYAICGMGVLGREMLRTILEDGGDILFVNETNMSIEQIAYLLAHDTIYYYNFFIKNGYNVSVSTTGANASNNYLGDILVGGRTIPVYSYSSPSQMSILSSAQDVVAIDCTGYQPTDMSGHLGEFITSGAKFSIGFSITNRYMTLPTIVYGVNEKNATGEHSVVIPYNMAVHAASVLLNGIDNVGYNVDSSEVFITDVHSYTNLQNLEDSAKDATNFEIGRAGAWNIIPTTNNTIIGNMSITAPSYNGRINCIEYRVPVVCGGATTMSFESKDFPTSISTLSAFGKNYLHIDQVCEYSEERLCTSDIIGKDYAMVATPSNGYSSRSGIMFTFLYDNIHGLALQTLNTAKYMYSNA